MGLQNLIGSHHLMVLVLQDVAVPRIDSCKVAKASDDPGHLSWICSDGILPTSLSHLRLRPFSGIDHPSRSLEFCYIKRLPVEDLESDKVKVNRMRIRRRVHEAPDLHSVENRLLADRVAPSSVSQEKHKTAKLIGPLYQGQVSGADRVLLRKPLDRRYAIRDDGGVLT